MERRTQTTILSSTDAATWARALMSSEQEELWIFALAANQAVLGSQLLFRGTANACLAHPRDVMKAAMRYACDKNAVGFLLAHNHPSGELTPSEEDWHFTRAIIECGRLFQIPLVDHLVITQTSYTSMRSLDEIIFISDGSQADPDSKAAAVRCRARPKSRSCLSQT